MNTTLTTSFIFLFVHLYAAGIMAQTTSENTNSEQMAQQYFKDGNWEKALNLYESLSERFPGEADYRYHAGVTMVLLNKDMERALNHLHFAVLREVPVDVYYYLALAHFKRYEIKEAREQVQLFLEFGRKSDIRSLQARELAQKMANAELIYRFGYSLEGAGKEKITAEKLGLLGSLKNFGGRFGSVPQDLQDYVNTIDGFQGLCFYPDNLQPGDYMYFSAYSKLSSSNADIYRAEYMGNDAFNRPEKLPPSVNTPEDELFPVYHPKSQTLYFSSKGHFNSGGYDVFVSTNKGEPDNWSEVENKDFPLNSPANEYFLIPSDKSPYLLLASDRETSGDEIMLYQLNIPETNKLPEEYAEAKELRRQASITKKYLPAGTIFGSPVFSSAKKEEIPDRNSTRFVEDADYDRLLNEALKLQLRADSFIRVAREMRHTAAKIQDKETRYRLAREITQNEQEGKRIQELADVKYTEVRAMEEKQRKQSPPPITNKVRNQFISAPKVQQKEITVTSQAIDAFAIYRISPYSNTNPFISNIAFPQGVCYRIQLGAFSQKKSYDAFGGISPISTEKIKERSIIKYYAGLFSTYEKAQKALHQVQNEGYKDAFVVAYYNGQKISSNRAKTLE